MTEPTHKFDDNLLKLSKSKNLETAKKEWREIYREQREEKTGLCICQHTLKNIIYMYNISTKYTISVGTRCCKKFKLQIIKLNNNILENVISKMLINGEYKIINNIIEYTNNIQTQLIKYIRNEYENMTNLEKLKKLNNDIKILITEYDLKYLHDIYDEIMNKIINDEQLDREKTEKIHIKQIEFEKNRTERIKAKQIEFEKNKTERIKANQINQIEFEKKMELENSKFCYRCNKNLNNDNSTKYEKEITKIGILFACNICSSLINGWLNRGCQEKSFTY
jgi:hypothetical protein